jgi:hypothetical protein
MPLATALPTAEPLQALIHRLARELRIAAAVADDCQDAVGDATGLELDPYTAVRLQGLDLLSQHLIEIGLLLDRIASAGNLGDAPGGLLDDIRLGELRQRLTGVGVGGIRLLDAELW